MFTKVQTAVFKAKCESKEEQANWNLEVSGEEKSNKEEAWESELGKYNF